jgi:hypothetical protein
MKTLVGLNADGTLRLYSTSHSNASRFNTSGNESFTPTAKMLLGSAADRHITLAYAFVT